MTNLSAQQWSDLALLTFIIAAFLWICYGRSLALTKKKTSTNNESAIVRDARWDAARATGTTTQGENSSMIKQCLTYNVGGLSITEIQLTDEARQRLCVGKEATERFLKAPLSDFTASESNATARPGWTHVWMSMARMIARRSYDPRLKVGCIIIPEDNTGILSLGYNGNAKGLPNEVDSLEPGQSGMLHSELNACLKLNPHDPRRKIMYVTHFPCRNCCKIIIQSGISKVVYGEVYRDMTGADLLQQSSIEVVSYDEALITG